MIKFSAVNFNIEVDYTFFYQPFMVGLRERQKKLRRKSMLKAALALFTERGYEAVKLEEIAFSAGVSSGTIYTYFKTKNELLLAVIVEDFDMAFQAGDEVISGPIADAATAINQMTDSHFSEHDGGVTREMWRVAVAAFLRTPRSEFALEYERCLSKMQRQYFELVRRLRSEGFISRSLNANELASILYNNANMCFLEFIRDEDSPKEVLEARLQRHNARLLKWINLVE